MKIFFVKIMITLGHFHVLSITEQYRWVIQTGLFSLVYIFLTANCCLCLDENLYQDLESVLKVSNEAIILSKSDAECKSSWTYCVMVVIQINLCTSLSFCGYHWVPYDPLYQTWQMTPWWKEGVPSAHFWYYLTENCFWDLGIRQVGLYFKICRQTDLNQDAATCSIFENQLELQTWRDFWATD